VKSTEWTSNLDLQKDINLGLAAPLVAVGANTAKTAIHRRGRGGLVYRRRLQSTSGAEAGVLRTSGSQG
jgi:iron complex outermembrane receptor protein